MRVFNNLKKYRTEKGFSQQFVATKMGIVLRLYQYYEAGEREPSVRTAIKLARTLGTTIEELFPLPDEE